MTEENEKALIDLLGTMNENLGAIVTTLAAISKNMVSLIQVQSSLVQLTNEQNNMRVGLPTPSGMKPGDTENT